MINRVLACLFLLAGVALAQALLGVALAQALLGVALAQAPAATLPAQQPQAPTAAPSSAPAAAPSSAPTAAPSSAQPAAPAQAPTAVPADPSAQAPTALPLARALPEEPPAGTAGRADSEPKLDSEPPPPTDAKDAAPPGPAIEPEHDLSFDGRVRMGAELRSRKLRVGVIESREKDLELALADARFGIEYRALGWLSVQLEADFVGTPELKDGFVRVENKHLRGQFGQFKVPVSALAMESPWKLPVPERGFIQGILVEHVQMIGRHQGALGRWRGGGKLKPELSLGLFQGWVGNDLAPIEPDLNVDETLDSQNAVARLGGRVLGIDLGLTGQRISTMVASKVRHFWVAGLDATADYDLSSGGARFWLEGFTGTTWRATSDGLSQPKIQFFTARGVLAWRWGGQDREQAYIEPFALGAIFDPDLETHSDLVWETMLGVNAGAWKRFRVGLTGKLGGSGRGVPQQVFPGNALRDEKALELQVGAAF